MYIFSGYSYTWIEFLVQSSDSSSKLGPFIHLILFVWTHHFNFLKILSWNVSYFAIFSLKWKKKTENRTESTFFLVSSFLWFHMRRIRRHAHLGVVWYDHQPWRPLFWLSNFRQIPFFWSKFDPSSTPWNTGRWGTTASTSPRTRVCRRDISLFAITDGSAVISRCFFALDLILGFFHFLLRREVKQPSWRCISRNFH